MNNKKNGFTLIELLVVIAIIGILAGIILVSFNNFRQKARDAYRAAEIKKLQNALEIYYLNHGYYPQYTNIGVRCNTRDLIGSRSLDPLVNEKIIPNRPIDPINTNTTPNRLCYEYIGIGTASNYNGSSIWYCDGKRRTDYQYCFMFSNESMTLNFPRLTNSSGTPNNEYKYCIHGPLR